MRSHIFSLFGFVTISRVVRLFGINIVCEWHITESLFVLSLVDDLVDVLVVSLVCDDRDVSVESLCILLVLNVLLILIFGFCGCVVLGDPLSSVFGFESGVVSSLSKIVPHNLVIISESSLIPILVVGLVLFLLFPNYISVTPFLLLLVVCNLVSCLVKTLTRIIVVNLGPIFLLDSWHISGPLKFCNFVEDFKFSSIPFFFASPVPSLDINVCVMLWNLSYSDLVFNLVCKLVFGVIIVHWHIDDFINQCFIDVGMSVFIFVNESAIDVVCEMPCQWLSCAYQFFAILFDGCSAV